MRDKKGRFLKGIHYSFNTEFKKGKKHPNWKGGLETNKKYRREYQRKWQKQWFQTSKGKRYLRKHKKYRRKWIQENKEHINEYQRNLQKFYKLKNPKFRLDCNISTAIYVSLKGKKSGRNWEKLVGYNLENLIDNLEERFDDKMNWDNYGSYWHVDHIVPKNRFKYQTAENKEFKECWALENLQPLEKIENLRKKK